MSDQRLLSCSVTTGDAAAGVFTREWNDLAARSPHATAFQSAAWYRAWISAVAAAEAKVPVVVSIRDGRQLVAAIPLQCGDEGGVKTIQFLSAPWADYHDAIGDLGNRAVAATARAAIAGVAADFAAQVGLSDLVSGGCLDAALPRSVPRSPGTSVFSIDLADLDHLRQIHGVKEYAAKARRLDRLGNVSCRHYSARPEIDARFDHLIALHREQWADRADAVAPFDDGVERGFRAMIREMAPAGNVIYTEFTIDQRVLASYFGFRWGSWYGAYRTAFDGSFRKYSPGHLMLRRMLTDFQRDGIWRFDLARGAHEYKLRYVTEVSRNLNVNCSGPELLAE